MIIAATSESGNQVIFNTKDIKYAYTDNKGNSTLVRLKDDSGVVLPGIYDLATWVNFMETSDATNL